MQAVILCGGEGSRLREQTADRPKPLLPIGDRPILWHIMKTYAVYGYRDFVLCLGYRGDLIRDYFLQYDRREQDLTLTLGDARPPRYATKHAEAGWNVTLANTGEHTQTGARIYRVRGYLGGEDFMVTYGDGVGDVAIDRLVRFHRSHGRLATVTAVRHRDRFGALQHERGLVTRFSEKPVRPDAWINAGFFVFRPEFIPRYLSDEPDCVLEDGPLRGLVDDDQLMLWRHDGYWQCMDTYREWRELCERWETDAAWKAW